MSETPFIGVLSDTHGYYDPVLDDLFAGAAGIVHAGDIGDYGILARLRGLAPLTVVAGNTDLPYEGLDLPWEAEAEIAGLRIIVCHIGASLMGRHDPVLEGFDLVISGHSHRAAVEMARGDAVPQPRRGRAAALRAAAHGRARRRGRAAGAAIVRWIERRERGRAVVARRRALPRQRGGLLTTS